MSKNPLEEYFDINLVEDSFAQVAGQADVLVERFYTRLFAEHPEVKPLFANTEPAAQRRKLVGALAAVVKGLRDPAALVETLKEMGRRHEDYGAQPAHYAVVAGILIDEMKQLCGDSWTPETEHAWTEAFQVIASTMLGAYAHPEDNAMNAPADNTSEKLELTRLRSAMNSTLTAIMMVDRDLVVTYANGATRDLLARHADALGTVFRGFDADKIIGSCIDMFHKNPAHQRKLLADPSNLPFSTDIHIAHLTFNINVTAQIDDHGEFIGCTLEWYDVTEQRAKETEVARLQSAIDGSTAALMLCDSDFVVTYANPSVVELLRNRQKELRALFPGFDADKLIGSCIDQFHKNPAHQRALLSDPSRLPARAQIKVADLEFEVNATAILDHNGKYMGNMVEWKDITEQKDAERQIASLIEATARGEFDRKIEVDNYTGFVRTLGEGINSLIDAVVTPLRECNRVMDSMSSGDLTQVMEGEFAGEFAALMQAVNSSIVNLRDMVEKIRGSALSINSAASEVSKGNTELSARTEEQASSLEETAASMEEMTSTVQQNADNSRQADQLASSTRDQAAQGGEVVGRAVAAMSEINESSKKIADIIGVIDEIAFQTNLLALNAAVEAARAGEQGRGFAVVASEVRNLAQRSASAAKEIKALINDSVQKVTEGSKLVDESGATLTEIVNSVKKVSDIIGEIAVASEEQSSGISQVNQAVTQMDQMTQQNAALVEEAAAASESMDEESRSLLELMQFFNTGEGMTLSAAPAGNRPAVERRSADRPWNDQQQAGRPAQRAAKPAAKAAAAGGDVWEEF
ncbi:MAG: methyl-accepting chemotaxis protein [Gammaproteobacteria bacterium]